MSRNFFDELALKRATADFTGGAGVPTVDLRGRKAGTDRVCEVRETTNKSSHVCARARDGERPVSF